MPFINITITNPEKIDKIKIMQEISKIAGEESGKGEGRIMVAVTAGEFILNTAPAESAFIDFRGIGKIEKDINAAISKRVSAIIQDMAHIPPQNIYLNFTDIPGENWGTAQGVH